MSSFKAIERRKKTLLVEYQNQFKANKFLDKRIGENDPKLSLEDKMFKRFERQRQKKNRYNLNEDEGNDMQEYNSGPKVDLTHYGQSLAQIEKFERVESSDDDEHDEDPNSDRGKINAKIVSENFFGGFQEQDEGDKKKARKDWIEEMIAKSKQIKYERQKERDKTLDLTDELDKEWRNIMPLLSQMDKKLKDKAKEDNAQKKDNATKPDDYDVLVRSLQFESEKAKPTDRAKTEAEIQKEQEKELKQQQKEMLARMNDEIDAVEFEKQDKKAGLKFKKGNHVSPDDIEFDDPEYVEARRRDEIAAKRKFEAQQEELKKKEKEQAKKEDESDGDEVESEVEVEEEIEVETEPDAKELEDPLALTRTMIQRYQSLFRFKSPSQAKIDHKAVDAMTRRIYELVAKYGGKSTKKDPSKFLMLFREILTDLSAEFSELKWSQKRLPPLDILYTFKLIGNVFPTSDFRHQITTPCLLIMTRYLSECSIQTVGDCFRGIFLCHLCYQFISKPRRFIPECIQFLNGILYLSIDWSSQTEKLTKYDMTTVFEVFRRSQMKLLINEKTNEVGTLSLAKTSMIEKKTANNTTIAGILAYCVDLITTFVTAYQDMVAFREVFALTSILLKLLPSENYPAGLKERISSLQEFIKETSDKPREFLKALQQKPVLNKTFEPKIISKVKSDPKHNHLISEKQLEARQYKKELKSAIKEVKQDAQYLSRVRLEEQMKKDAKRKQKVKEIMGSLANQEGEFQKIKRMKS